VSQEIIEASSGEILIKKGDSWDKFILILSGEILVTEWPEGPTGRAKELGCMGAGECIGETALFDDVPRFVSIRTTEESRFLVLQKQAFEGIVKEYPEIAFAICKDLSARLRTLHEKVKG